MSEDGFLDIDPTGRLSRELISSIKLLIRTFDITPLKDLNNGKNNY